jgi:NitT/TauT family transport system substrate-binding protein
VEVERLQMAIRDNILTTEVRTNGYGGVDIGRFEQAIDQIGLAYKFKAKPSVADVFDSSFLPPAGERWAR